MVYVAKRGVGYTPGGLLVAARLRYVAGTRWGLRRYMDMARLAEQDRDREVATADAAA